MNKRKLLWLFTLFLFPVGSVYASGSDVVITEVHVGSDGDMISVIGQNLCGPDTTATLGINESIVEADVFSCDPLFGGLDLMIINDFDILESGSYRLTVDNSKGTSKKCGSKKGSKKHSHKKHSHKKSNKSCGVDKFEFAFDLGGGDGVPGDGITQDDLDEALEVFRLDVNCDLNAIIKKLNDNYTLTFGLHDLLPVPLALILPPLPVDPFTCTN